MTRRGAFAALLATALAAGVASCGGSGRAPFTIGVIVDCQGAFRGLHDQELAGASLPLLTRGAAPSRDPASDAPGPVTVAGRRVRLVPACAESGEFASLTQAARTLVGRERADVVVDGGPFTVDGIVLHEIAARHPGAIYLSAGNGPREVTLRGAAPSLYRFAADQTQGGAGLAAYAYRRLGWRRAAVAVEDWGAGWQPETAFTREFCALGGRVVRRTSLESLSPSAAQARGVPPRNADGLVVFASPFFMNGDLLRALARATGDPSRRLLLGPEIVGDGELLRDAGRVLAGVVGSSYTVPPADSPAVRDYRRAFSRFYPGSLLRAAGDPLVVGYRNAVEATLQALQRAGGEPGPGLRRLRAQLAATDTRLLGIPVRLDARHQAVVSATLVRVGRAHPGAVPPLRRVATIPGVDATLGGLVPAGYVPSSAGPGACRERTARARG
ncbi:MAG TPA: ABC transporter substrate-binding protein [Solirubrobacteraceae bacterium]|nr:ABC transporter substrate-binding protein [Solirubrobacteraceae bacterium]